MAPADALLRTLQALPTCTPIWSIGLVVDLPYPETDTALRETRQHNQRFATLVSLPSICLLPWRQQTAHTEQGSRPSRLPHRQMSCRPFCLTSTKRRIRTNLAQKLKPSLQRGTLLAAGLAWRRFVKRSADGSQTGVFVNPQQLTSQFPCSLTRRSALERPQASAPRVPPPARAARAGMAVSWARLGC
jgi:hypothetical protein